MSAKPGWYPDQLNPGLEIYFDGTAWTGEKRRVVDNPGNQVQTDEVTFRIPIPPQYLEKKKLIAFFSVALILIGSVTGINIYRGNVAQHRAEVARAEAAQAEADAAAILEKLKNDVSWVPGGYTPWRLDKSVAWKWVNNAGNDCYSCRYWTVQVISKYGCANGIYGEINIERNGTVVSYTNDSLSYLSPMQTGRLSFETYLEGSFQGSLTELNCR